MFLCFPNPLHSHGTWNAQGKFCQILVFWVFHHHAINPRNATLLNQSKIRQTWAIEPSSVLGPPAVQSSGLCGSAQWANTGIVFILQLLLKIFRMTSHLSAWIWCLLALCKCTFLCQSKILSESMHWLNNDVSLVEYILHSKSLFTPSDMPPSSGVFSIVAPSFLSVISIPPLPAFCPFQVPVPRASWGSRCLVIAYLETPSTQPLGWNPLASVRREIVFLRGQRLCLSAGGNCGITCTRSASEMMNEWPFFTLNDHKTVILGLATFAFVATVYWSLFFPLAQF